VSQSRHKYDFAHLNISAIDDELHSLDANLERDMAKLRRQYEKRERALRQAKAGNDIDICPTKDLYMDTDISSYIVRLTLNAAWPNCAASTKSASEH